ncbi:Ankyrin repeat domain-containing protein 13C [Labeo rohita]|uniref:Ankyrin repeat domain-containing protein 13C n=1 Tax=Labeo rohita TaxID=84645 RepID=A0ABQ8MAP7_LABRO|nr:Ankyrin repeat domain-containing protein 13C [Labeo rohita]
MTGEKIRSVRKERKAGLDLLEPDEEPADTGPIKANRGSKIFSGGSNHKIIRSASQQNQNQNRGDTDSAYPVHECVFRGDVRRLSSLIRTQNIAQKDLHGNTPLHLAVMMGHKECAHLLLAHNAPVKVKNAQGWSPLAEAISYGDRQMTLVTLPRILSGLVDLSSSGRETGARSQSETEIRAEAERSVCCQSRFSSEFSDGGVFTALLRKLKQQSRESVEDKRPRLLKALKELGDFYLELHWDFQSWVPLLSRILPSDACKIYKQGINIRLDTTLIDFTDMKCQRGDLSFIFCGDAAPSESFVVLDNEQKVYQRIHHEARSPSAQRSRVCDVFQESEMETEEEERVGNFLADFYMVNGLVLEAPHLGRELVCKESKKNFKATVAMSQDFPLGIESHPGFPHHHCHRDLSGVPIRRVRQLHFYDSQRLQRGSQPLPRPLSRSASASPRHPVSISPPIHTDTSLRPLLSPDDCRWRRAGNT